VVINKYKYHAFNHPHYKRDPMLHWFRHARRAMIPTVCSAKILTVVLQHGIWCLDKHKIIMCVARLTIMMKGSKEGNCLTTYLFMNDTLVYFGGHSHNTCTTIISGTQCDWIVVCWSWEDRKQYAHALRWNNINR
jgi:hypothetical protein